MNKKILFIIPSLGGGGSEKILFLILQHLKLTHIQVKLAVVIEEGLYFSQVPESIEKINLQAKRMRFAFPKIYNLIKKEKPDIVFSFNVNHVSMWVSLASIFLPKKIKYYSRESTIPSFGNSSFSFSSLLNNIYRWRYKYFDQIIAQSEYMKEDLNSKFGVPKEKITVITNPVDFNEVRQKSLIPITKENKQKYIIAVGRLVKIKRFHDIIQAFHQLHSTNLNLIIIGGQHPLDPDYPKELKEQVEALKLTDKIFFSGFLANPFPLIKNAELLVMASEYEGLPNVVLEANALGVPAIAYKAPGGIPEIIKDDLNGYLCEYLNIDDLTEKIRKGLNKNWNKEKISRFIEDKHSISKVLPQYEIALKR